MSAALSLDPTVTQKRLGDGFYEQRLIREQVSLLTGRRFAGNYTTDEQQFEGLMDGGIAYARAYSLRPGIALSAAQMAVLTTDIIWLVEQTITVPDGKGGTTQVKALVPQLYVKVQPGDLDGTGTLMAGVDVDIDTAGDVINTGAIAGSASGSVAGRRLVNITANNLQNLGGRITGGNVSVAARNDINIIGGQIDAASSLRATAGRDLNVTTTTTSATNQNGANTNSLTRIDRVAGLYVTGQGTANGGTLIATAGRDINLTAAVIQAQGNITLDAGNNLNLGVLTTGSQNTQNRGPNNYLNDATSRDIGTAVTSTRNIALSAGNDINAKASAVDAQGGLSATAARDINLTEGQQSSSTAYAMRTSSSGFLSASSTQLRTGQDSTQAVGSSFGGGTVTLNAERDINIKASSVIGDKATTAVAGNNINITAGQNTSGQTYFYEKKESGLLSAGGLGISIGKREQSNADAGQSSTAAASTVGSINGNVNLIAGNQYR